jgi:hypothetical protein
MRAVIFGVLFFSGCLSTNVGKAQDKGVLDFYTNGTLLDACSNPTTRPTCVGYILGTVDAAEIARHVAGRPECLSTSVSTTQIYLEVYIYLVRHRDDRDSPAAASVMKAVQAKWCPG